MKQNIPIYNLKNQHAFLAQSTKFKIRDHNGGTAMITVNKPAYITTNGIRFKFGTTGSISEINYADITIVDSQKLNLTVNTSLKLIKCSGKITLVNDVSYVRDFKSTILYNTMGHIISEYHYFNPRNKDPTIDTNDIMVLIPRQDTSFDYLKKNYNIIELTRPESYSKNYYKLHSKLYQ